MNNTSSCSRRPFLASLLGAALAAGLAAPAAAPAAAQAPESTLDIVKKRGTLVAGIKTDYAPFGYIDEKGNNAGFDIEIVKYIAKKLGVGVDLRPVTSGNRIPMLQSGTVDMLAASITITRERAEAVEFSVPYIVIGTKFLVKKGSGIRGYADLAGKTAAYTQGTPWGEKLMKEQPQAKALVLQDKPQAVQAVLQGKAVAYIDDAAPLLLFAKMQPELEAVGEASKPGAMGLASRLNDAKWRNAINFALIDMWKDGTYLKLYKEFFGTEPDPNFQIYTWEL
jgi:polar amino acid transport system substrate-binding protein